jgi:hypothetical protein
MTRVGLLQEMLCLFGSVPDVFGQEPAARIASAQALDEERLPSLINGQL